jgi:hypothetical protein
VAWPPSRRRVPESLRCGARGKGPGTIREAREGGALRTRVVVAPSRTRLSGGALVEASILARVLGLRLLTLDATVAIVPADVARPSEPPPRPTSSRSPAVGRGLADAVQSINEGAKLLADARRNGS